MVDVVPGRDGPENVKILERQVVEFRPLERAVVFFNLIKANQFGSRPAEMSWDLRHHKMNRAWGGVSKV